VLKAFKKLAENAFSPTVKNKPALMRKQGCSTMKKTKTKKVRVKAKPKSDASLEHRLHTFLKEWKTHIHDEISIHRQLLTGRQSFKQHLNQTVKIHQKFVNRIKKI